MAEDLFLSEINTKRMVNECVCVGGGGIADCLRTRVRRFSTGGT
jgi:hypothetical protein